MTLIILCLAAFAVVSYAMSGAAVLGLQVFRRSIDQLAPVLGAGIWFQVVKLHSLRKLMD